jgi:beta-1,4-mannosyl-glycoprotein beta-1,4-N-acetylglucosaminyltransferase
MIYDCFQFFNEIDLLKLRLHTLNPMVDYFVITESTVTFSGDKKPLYYYQNREKFSEFNHKIIHNVVEDTPMGVGITGFDRDGFQKEARARPLINCKPEDVIIYSDLDEIPNPTELSVALKSFDNRKIYHFALRQFYYYLNLEEVSGKLLSYAGDFASARPKKWLGPFMFCNSLRSEMPVSEIRINKSIDRSVRINDGGWHFTYMGGDSKNIVDRVAHKIRSSSHQEFNNSQTLSKIEKRIKSGKDIFGRKAKLRYVELDETFPRYLLENLHLFEHLILPRPKDTLYSKIRNLIFGVL